MEQLPRHGVRRARRPGDATSRWRWRTALVEHLRRRWPDRYGEAALDPTLHPLDAAARLVPEDLVLLVERDGQLVFGGGSVCFPNRWDLRSKLGLTMAGVHAPVDRLNDQLEAPIDSFFDRLTPDRSFWRLGWGVLDTPDWYTPVDGTAAPRPVAPAPDQHFLRVERETLRRFPDTGCVLFTIRTYVTPILSSCPTPAVSRAVGVGTRVASRPTCAPTRISPSRPTIWRSCCAGVRHQDGTVTKADMMPLRFIE